MSETREERTWAPEDLAWEAWQPAVDGGFQRYRVLAKDGINGKYKGWIVGGERLTLEVLNALEQERDELRAKAADTAKRVRDVARMMAVVANYGVLLECRDKLNLLAADIDRSLIQEGK